MQALSRPDEEVSRPPLKQAPHAAFAQIVRFWKAVSAEKRDADHAPAAGLAVFGAVDLVPPEVDQRVPTTGGLEDDRAALAAAAAIGAALGPVLLAQKVHDTVATLAGCPGWLEPGLCRSGDGSWVQPMAGYPLLRHWVC